MFSDLLRKVPLFVSLPDEEIDLLARTLREVDYPKGEVLFFEGERRNDFT